jgi:hypothetical protein
MNKAAAENGLKVEESGFFQRTDPVPGLGAARRWPRPRSI